MEMPSGGEGIEGIEGIPSSEIDNKAIFMTFT